MSPGEVVPLLIGRRDPFAVRRRQIIARRIDEALSLPRQELDRIERAFGYVPVDATNPKPPAA